MSTDVKGESQCLSAPCASEIEADNRRRENEKLDLLEEKRVKPNVYMVRAGIMAVETAQKMLGLDLMLEEYVDESIVFSQVPR